MRVGAALLAAVAFGLLLPAAEGAEQTAVAQAESERLGSDPVATYARVTTRALALRNQRRSAEIALAVARRSLSRAERRLGARLHALYVQGQPDPLEVILGARSFDDAIASIDGLERIGRQEAAQVRALQRARENRESAVRRLRAQEQRAADLRRQAAAALHALQTRRLSSRSASRPDEPLASSPAAPQANPLDRLTVLALGYSMSGDTAAGLPAGVGTVAVDPAVIPLGTVLTIPGYGRGVAADTGSSIRGAVIDLWFTTPDQARAWGRRVVTVNLDRG